MTGKQDYSTVFGRNVMNKDEAQTLVNIHGLERSKDIVANCPKDCTHYSWKLGDTDVLDKTVCIADLKRALEVLEDDH